eukprot:14891296-Alexandrium_andersonii.AAC.1
MFAKGLGRQLESQNNPRPRDMHMHKLVQLQADRVDSAGPPDDGRPLPTRLQAPLLQCGRLAGGEEARQ